MAWLDLVSIDTIAPTVVGPCFRSDCGKCRWSLVIQSIGRMQRQLKVLGLNLLAGKTMLIAGWL